MANQISLLGYLQYGPPEVDFIDQGQSKDNTTNPRYSADDITTVRSWTAFRMDTIMLQYTHLLRNTLIESERTPTSPPHAINSEDGVRDRFNEYLKPRIRRALRCGFESLSANNQLGNRTKVVFDGGRLAQIIDNYVPDVAYFDPNLPPDTRPNRLPGEFKSSCKWSSGLQGSFSEYAQTQFRQALAQVNFYMKQHKARYGFILTDKELVAIKRLDGQGNLELSDPIPWDTQGNGAQPRLTILLALWYLGMLASDKQQWTLP